MIAETTPKYYPNPSFNPKFGQSGSFVLIIQTKQK